MRIVNIKRTKDFHIYIGRANKHYGIEKDSIFCNPYVIGKDGTRPEVIKKFEHYAQENPLIMDNLWLIDGMILGCWCEFPMEDCHGRILFELREHQKLNELS